MTTKTVTDLYVFSSDSAAVSFAMARAIENLRDKHDSITDGTDFAVRRRANIRAMIRDLKQVYDRIPL